MQTNFQKVTEFNTVLGQGVAEAARIPSFDQVKLRLNLINEEAIQELSAALMDRDLVSVADAIGDALVVVYGAANDCGLDADAIFEVIHQSNMSKLCDSEEDAKHAVEQYALGNGFHGKNEPIECDYRQSSIEGKYIVFNKQTGKTLKGPNFFEPKEMLEEVIYPNGRSPLAHVDERNIARKMVVNKELSIADSFFFEEILDMVESSHPTEPSSDIELPVLG